MIPNNAITIFLRKLRHNQTQDVGDLVRIRIFVWYNMLDAYQANASFGRRSPERTATTHKSWPIEVATLSTKYLEIISPAHHQHFTTGVCSRLRHLTTRILSLRKDPKLNRSRPGPSLIRRRLLRWWRYRNHLPTAREAKISKPLRTRRSLIIRILRTSLHPLLASALALSRGIGSDFAPDA